MPPGARLERLAGAMAWWLCAAAALALVGLMVGVTVVDVVLRRFDAAIPGAFELVTLGMRVAVPLALPWTFWRGGHVAVELLTELLPAPVQRLLRLGAWTLCAAVMAYTAWTVSVRALEIRAYGDVTANLGLPEFYYWLPLMLGSAACVPVLLVMMLRELRAPPGPGTDVGP